MKDVTIAVCDDPEPCYRIRHSVFIDEQGFPEDRDELDETATHILAMANGQPIGAARIVFEDQTAKIGRVCLIPSARGAGLGAALIQNALEIARDAPAIKIAKLSAQVSAMGFYQALGFVAEGSVYDDLGVPHRMMARAL